MKKWKTAILLCSVWMLIAMLSGCGNTANNPTAQPSAADTAASAAMPTVVNTAEYVLYQNIFKNDAKSDYSGKNAEKKGTFATVYDAFNSVTRYYVWGYNDQTKCCDWQWELKLDDTADLPGNGSLIRVTGVYEENEDALDKFWIIHPQITVEKPFDDKNFDIDMQSMDDTLERVQTLNIIRKAEAFEGQTVCGYGRVLDKNTLQDPYYDNSWTISMAGDYELPAFGTLVLFSGTVQNGSVADCKLTANTQY